MKRMKSFQDKIVELKNKISEELTPLIGSDYILLNLLYYDNIGDTLIWEGEETFLSSLPYKCLYRSSINTYNRDKNFDTAVTILMQGGGNFGDLWSDHQKFRLEIVEKFRDNPIVIFPVSVHYLDNTKMLEDARLMAQHENLTICVRDQASYNLLKEHFSNNILLVPDMAFWIDPAQLQQYNRLSGNRALLLKRNDKELSADYDYTQHIEGSSELDILDWPTKQKVNFVHRIVNRPLHRKSPFKSFADRYAYRVYRPYLIKKGVRFLSNYNYIYTTRLHGAI